MNASERKRIERLMIDIRRAQTTNLCPVCHTRPGGVWPDGEPHITCGNHECLLAWVRPGRREVEHEAAGD